MSDQEVTLKRCLSIWWLMMWRGILGGWVAGGVAGFMWTLIIGNLQGAGLAGLIAGVVWGIYVIRMALCKKYSDFRIALVK